MANLKIGIIGAGSSYTPELIERLAQLKDELPVDEIALMDIDEKRLEIMSSFCRRYAEHLNYPVRVTSTTDRQRAIDGTAFLDVQIRVGRNGARVNDEKIPMKYGLIGQETTGAGGFMNAMRQIPAMLEIAGDVEKYSPDAWIVNYTNPTGLVAEAVNRYSKAKIAGLCAGGFFPRDWTSKALGVDPSIVKYDFAGLNHMNFSYNITIGGRPLTDEEFDKIAEEVDSVDSGLLKKLRLIPSPYLQYYFHTEKKLNELKKAPLTRGEVVQNIEKEVFEAYADPAQVTKPEALAKRGGGGYSEIAIGVINAIYNNQDTWMVINVPNQGTIKFLPDDAVIETGCLVNSSGIHPLTLNDVPFAVRGLIGAVKNYEQLAVEAAVTGNRDIAELALLAHPLISDYDVIRPLLNDLLDANRNYLPQFYK